MSVYLGTQKVSCIPGYIEIEKETVIAQIIQPKDVNFIDYDGTLLYSYDAAEAMELTALPDNPSHTGLIAQGWNWTLTEIKDQLIAQDGEGPVIVGQLYLTTSGATEFDIELTSKDYLSFELQIFLNGTIEIDWGDNSSIITLTNNSFNTPKLSSTHVYNSIGNYTIKINVTNGSFRFGRASLSNNKFALFKPTQINSSTNEPTSRYYIHMIKAIRIGTGVTYGYSSFEYYTGLKYITFPANLSENNINFNTYTFSQCYSLKAVILPQKSFFDANNEFYDCNSLEYVSLPGNFSSLECPIFGNCYSLKYITLPLNITHINSQNCFLNCSALKKLIAPNVQNLYRCCYSCSSLEKFIGKNVSTVAGSVFSSNYSLQKVILGKVNELTANLFQNCRTLSSITIPAEVTSINGSAFYYCQSLCEYHFLSTTPPSLSSSYDINNNNSYYVIYVPYSSDHSILAAYQSATNWSNIASHIQEEPQ